MNNQNASYVLHDIFYKYFFGNHRDLIKKFISLNFRDVKDGYDDLMVFYSSYAYYINSGDNKRDLVIDSLVELKNNTSYQYLSAKIGNGGIESFSMTEIKQLNTLYYEELYKMLKLFETFNHTLGSDDLMPRLTKDAKEHDRNVVYAHYNEFYTSLFDLHKMLYGRLLTFNVLDYREVVKFIMCFYFGYSYYIKNKIRPKIEKQIRELFEITNDDEFIKLYYGLLNNNINGAGMAKLSEYKDSVLQKALEIFEYINTELPKTNLMPKKIERVKVDVTLI